MDYLWIIVMFLSDVWTLILTAPIHCRGSIGEQVMKCFISPNDQDGAAMFGCRPGRSAKTMHLFTFLLTFDFYFYISYFFIHFILCLLPLCCFFSIFALSMERTRHSFHCWLYSLCIVVYVTNKTWNLKLETWRNKLTSQMVWRWVNFQQIFILGWI